MKKRIDISRVSGFLKWQGLLAEGKREELSHIPCPKRIAWKRVPDNLNGLTFGQLSELLSIQSDDELFYTGAKVVLGLPRWYTRRARTEAMLGFVNMLGREMERITDIIAQCSVPNTPEEIQAGASRLNFGWFGMADWYAKRMGMTNHDEAFETGWMRIVQCLKNDAETTMYNRRLNEIMQNKYKSSKR